MSEENKKSRNEGVDATVMAHFYRGELGRMTAWRERFDRTTHWAIIATTGIITFAWTNQETSHFFFLLANAMLYLLLTIEARRYRFYDAYRGRVRILESHFIFPVVTRTPEHPKSKWRRQLGGDLIMPSLKITFFEALSRRFNRNYVWLFFIVLLAWVVITFANAPNIKTFGHFMAAFEKGQSIPSIVLIPIMSVFYAYLIFVGFYGRTKRKASGEFLKRPRAKEDDWSL
ncbi:MAG: DUF2270 domain-containing protein [Verrucomicrobiota bacterium]